MNVLPLVDLTQSLVIMGDFNVNICDDNNKAFVDFINQQFRCHQKITKTTTDKQSMLDLIFTNIDNVEVGVTECPWSDHNAIYLTIPNLMCTSALIHPFINKLSVICICREMHVH